MNREVAGALLYQTLINELYTDIESLDTSAYQWDASDRYRRARFMDAHRSGTYHLETWVTLTDLTEIGRSKLVYQGTVITFHRFQPEQDTMSQGRMQAAARHIIDLLLRWNYPPAGARTVPTGHTVEALSEAWLAVTTRFTLTMERGT